MTDSAAAPAPPPASGGIPVVPQVAPNTAPPSMPQAIWRGSVGAALIIAGLAGQIAGSGFPGNAPVEMFINFLITVTAIGAGVLLIVFAVIASRSRSLALTRGPVSPLAIAALAAGVIALVIWGLTVPAMIAESAQYGVRMRYQYLAGPAFGTGLLWSTAVVMGAISFRSPALVSRILAVAAVVLGFVLIATNIWAAGIYSAELTD